MDGPTGPNPDAAENDPARMLDALKAHPEWSPRERDVYLGRLVERFPADRLMAAVLPRLGDLQGDDAGTLLRLVETHATPERLLALGRALLGQPGLAPDRAWEALAVLDGAGVLDDFPPLAERWDELNEALDEDGSVDLLLAQIEGDPEGLWLALQGLNAVEPEVRAQIVAGLGARAPGPGLVEFFRLLAYASDAPTRTAALDALRAAPADAPGLNAAWLDLAGRHTDPDVTSLSNRRLNLPALARGPSAVHSPPAPKPTRGLVSAVNGQGRATILLAAEHGGEFPTAAFLCDVERGVVEVVGDVARSRAAAAETFAGCARELEPVATTEAPPLALALLAGCLLLRDEQTPPSLRFWVEATAGRDLHSQPFLASFPDWDPARDPLDDIPERAEAVLAACPDWLDGSPLTFELAEEILLREGDSPPNPKRDAGAYRFLFEHRLRARLETYRRMLLWNAWFWRSSGQNELARSALALAWQLSDAQHVVPGHPFTVALATRSLAAAGEALRRGRDPRKPVGR